MHPENVRKVLIKTFFKAFCLKSYKVIIYLRNVKNNRNLVDGGLLRR